MTNKPYPEYKDSGVEWIGEIPEGWKQSKLKYVCNITMGQSIDSNQVSFNKQDIPFLQGKAEFGEKHPTPKNYCHSGKKYCNKGDLLLSVRAPVGAINYADKTYAIGRGLASISAPTNLVSFYWYLLEVYRVELISKMTGSTFEAVTIEDVKNIKMFLPENENEMIKISQQLILQDNKLENLIKNKEKQIQLLEEKRQVVITETMTKGLDPNVPMKDSGIDWIGDIPVHWEVVRLKRLSTRIGDGLHGTPTYSDTGTYYFINGNNLGAKSLIIKDSTNKIDENEFRKYKNDLTNETIFISLNGTIGNLSIYNGEPVMLSKSVGYINLNDGCKEFIYYCLQSSHIETYFNLSFAGTTIDNLSLATLRNTPIFIPGRAEQLKIVEYLNTQLERYAAVFSDLEDQIQKLKECRESLIYEAVTGKIDLRDYKGGEYDGD